MKMSPVKLSPVRMMKLGAVALAFALGAAACGGGDDGGSDSSAVDNVLLTDTTVAPSTSRPVVTSSTTTLPIIISPDDGTDTTTTLASGSGGSGDPQPPANPQCLAGTGANELTLEWDAPDNPANVASVRVYMSEDGGPFRSNRGNLDVSELDTRRAGGNRWAATVVGVPLNVPVRLAATSFNSVGKESGWYVVEGLYTGQGQPCSAGESLPPTTCSVGCE